MENLLLTTKGACDLYMHGTSESNTANVANTFGTALKDTLSMQGGIYQKMATKGWYPTQQVEQQKIDQVRQKFSGASQ
jgi:spore coat protein CotF